MRLLTALMQVALALPAMAVDVGVEGKGIRIEVDPALHTRITARIGGKETAVGPFREGD